MEQNEGRGEFCKVFLNGTKLEEIQNLEGELIFGIYKDKYYFTNKAMLIASGNTFTRINWQDVKSCSSEHGDGSKKATVTLTNGQTVEVMVKELAIGWSGRISQLMHKMIERWGNQTSLGLPLLTVEEYFSQATDKYSFAPNLEPHPTLEEIKAALLELRESEGVIEVLISIAEYEEKEPVSTGIVVITESSSPSLEKLRDRLSATAVLEASSNTINKLNLSIENRRVQEVIWS